MGIGVSIFLIAVGAILAFAVHAAVAGVDIHVIGWILMAVGVLGLFMTTLIFAPRRQRSVVETRTVPSSGAVATDVAPPAMVNRQVRDDII